MKRLPASSASAARHSLGNRAAAADAATSDKTKKKQQKRRSAKKTKHPPASSVEQQLDELYKQAMRIEENMPVSEQKVRELSLIKHHVNHLLSREMKAELGARAAAPPRPREKGKERGTPSPPYYVPYPSVRDPELLRVLARKREYRQGAAPPIVVSARGDDDGDEADGGSDRAALSTGTARKTRPNKTSPSSSSSAAAARLWKERCKKGEFVLSPNQHLLKNLVSPRTPYNGLLLFHGVGVGKTCAAVTIAEQFPERPVIVVTPLDKSEFTKHVFDTTRLRLGPNGMLDVSHAANQCTGMRYINRLSAVELSNPTTMRNHIQRIINARYKVMTFYGFHKEVRAAFERGGGLRGVHERFRDHVIVIDEAHRLRSEDREVVKGGKATTTEASPPHPPDTAAATMTTSTDDNNNDDDGDNGDEEEEERASAAADDDAAAAFGAEGGTAAATDDVDESSEDTMGISAQRPVTDALQLVLQYSEGIKLLLLTATPMYNDTVDLLVLINMLLLNDKRKPLRNEQVFDRTNRLTEAGQRKLVNAAHGYVSYMRGDDPFAFPARFTPAANGDPAALLPAQLPTRTADGRVIPPPDRLRHTVLIGSSMGAYQAQVYRMLQQEEEDDVDDVASAAGEEDEEGGEEERHEHDEEEEEEDDELFWDGYGDDGDDDDDDNGKNGYGRGRNAAQQQQRQLRRRRLLHQTSFSLSNVTYPIDASAQPFSSGVKVRAFNSRAGFARCFEFLPGKALRVRYSAATLATPLNPSPLPFLAPEHIGRYAPKLKTIVDRILNSRGVVFVYSRYLWSGLFPLAIALEHVGISRYGGTPNILERTTTDGDDDDNNAGARGASQTQKRRAPASAAGRGWTYVTLTGDKDTFSASFARDMQAATSPENADGSVVKVILASSKAGEGLDLKFVREVHVLEPWYHFNRIEQVVGRAARNCSHAELPLEERNLTVYLHASLPPPSRRQPLTQQQETVDLWAYRLAEVKQRRIAEVERLLMDTAVDCPANYHALYYDPRRLGIRVDMVTSQGKSIAGYPLGDHPVGHPLHPSRWHRPSCAPVIIAEAGAEKGGEGGDAEDTSTYDPRWHAAGVENCRNVITRLFASGGFVGSGSGSGNGRRPPRPKLAFTLDDISHACFREYPRTVSIDAVMLAVQSMLDERTPVFDGYGRDGYIIFASDKYIFQPRTAFDERDPIRRRVPPPAGSVEEARDRVSAARFVYPPPPLSPSPVASSFRESNDEHNDEHAGKEGREGSDDGDAAAAAAAAMATTTMRGASSGGDERRKSCVLPAKAEGRVGRGLLAWLDQQAHALWEDTIAPTATTARARNSNNDKDGSYGYANEIVDFVIDRLDRESLLRLVRLVVIVEEAAATRLRQGRGQGQARQRPRDAAAAPPITEFLPRTSIVTPQRALQSLRRGNIVLPPPFLPPGTKGVSGGGVPVATVYDLFTDAYLQLLATPSSATTPPRSSKGRGSSDELHRAVVGARFDEVRGTFLQDALRADEGRRVVERLSSQQRNNNNNNNNASTPDASKQLAAYVTPTVTTPATFKVMGASKGSSGLSCHQTSSIKVEDLAGRILELEEEEEEEKGGPAAPLLDMTKKLDKRALCARYELALRRFRPRSFARPSVSARLFGAQQGKLRR